MICWCRHGDAEGCSRWCDLMEWGLVSPRSNSTHVLDWHQTGTFSIFFSVFFANLQLNHQSIIHCFLRQKKSVTGGNRGSITERTSQNVPFVGLSIVQTHGPRYMGYLWWLARCTPTPAAIHGWMQTPLPPIACWSIPAKKTDNCPPWVPAVEKLSRCSPCTWWGNRRCSFSIWCRLAAKKFRFGERLKTQAGTSRWIGADETMQPKILDQGPAQRCQESSASMLEASHAVAEVQRLGDDWLMARIIKASGCRWEWAWSLAVEISCSYCGTDSLTKLSSGAKVSFR